MSESTSHRLRWRGQVSGPFPLARILGRLDDNQIGLWHEIECDDGRWLTLEEFLAEAAAARRSETAPPRPEPSLAQPPRTSTAPPAPPTPPRFRAAAVRDTAGTAPKRLAIFVVSGFLLGFLGAHNFYAGYRGTAVAQLLLTVTLYALGFGLIATWLWALVELLVVHSDQRGRRMI
jgi:hypothetical protein